MEKYKVYVNSTHRYFKKRDLALDFVCELLELGIGGDISVETIEEENGK